MMFDMSDQSLPPSGTQATVKEHLLAAAKVLLAEYDELADEAVDLQERLRLNTERRNWLTPRLRQLADLVDQLGDDAHRHPAVATEPEGDSQSAEGKEESDAPTSAANIHLDSNLLLSWASPSNTREAVAHLLHGSSEPLGTTEIIDGVQAMGIDSQAATIRSLLSRMAADGQIVKLKRGLYQSPDKPSGGTVDGAEVDGYSPLRRSFVRGHYRLDEPELMPAQAAQLDDYEEILLPAEVHPLPDDDDAPQPPRMDLTHEDYVRWNREVEQAHLEDQADEEETSA